jgi:hypothetical protein
MAHTPVQPEGVQGAALHREEEKLLAAVAKDGAARLAHLCLDAWHGDAVAAGMTLGSLLRALPGVGPVGAHDLLRRVGATESTKLGGLTASQRGALANALAHAPQLAPEA